MRGYYEPDPSDRYGYQTHRQAEGLPCTDCGSHQGHFGFCPLFHKGLQVGRPSNLRPDYTDLYDKPQPDSQSFYRKAQEQRTVQDTLPVDYDPVYTEADRILAHSLGVKL